MKYSRLFGKTSKSNPSDSKFISHVNLIKGGFIAESVAGRYFFLPLGWRVHEKIKAIIKDEMDRAGAQEMITPTLHPLELWRETNRTNTTGFELMTVTDRRGAEFALGGTAEEMIVDVVRKFSISYKDLPFNIYQFSKKFRDELRARGGLLRVREFVMKDAYSFDRDEEAFKEEYARMARTYTRIFERCGIKTHIVAADNGYIGGDYSHEFIAEHSEGESTFFVTDESAESASKNNGYCAHEDVAEFTYEPINPDVMIEPFEIVELPEWVHTVADQVKHYQKDSRYFLKNVVYTTREGDLVVVTIRGDLEVHKTRLERLLNLVGQIEPATAEDLAAIGTQPGYVHAWGHEFVEPRQAKTEERTCRVLYVADNSLKTVRNIIGGQKEATTDSINVNYGRDFTHEIEGDVALPQDGFLAPDGQHRLIEKRGIEVGNIFQLGYHYTKLMKKATYTDNDGLGKPFYMGCYGIGLGRTLAAIVETCHDENGIIWPEEVAPFRVHLISLRGGEERAEHLYQALQEQGIDVLWDERDISPGAKFADADLIGCPFRLVVSKRTGEQIEFKRRTEADARLIDESELFREILM
ncbi:MAG: proline--tRNA ligase [Chloroflexota bacterium]